LLRNETINFSISTYQGVEAEVLSLRNRNRPVPRTQKYLDWRYLGLKSVRKPIIFWVQLKNRTRIGMAAIIFRPYWVNDELREVGILGDISLDMEYRGRGVARSWFAFVNGYLEKEGILGLVIPNPVAGKLLSATGWQIREKIVHHVYLLNPNLKLVTLVKSKKMAQCLGEFVSRIKGFSLARRDTAEFEIEEARTVDWSFDALWNNSSKKNMVVLDKGLPYLHWRYMKKLGSNYSVSKFLKNNRYVGYVIYSISVTDGTATIFEIFAEEGQEIKKMMIQFVRLKQKTYNLNSIRCPLNERHPYSSQLCDIGFSKRIEDTKFLTFSSDIDFIDSRNQWVITGGDKDV
jgi:hypothetical protein